MNDLNGWGLNQATEKQRFREAERLVDSVFQRVRQPLIDAVVSFFTQPLSPLALMRFEVALLKLVRELGRHLLEVVLNACEPDLPDLLPQNLSFEIGGYRRRINFSAGNAAGTESFGHSVTDRLDRSPDGHRWIQSDCRD